VRGVYVGHIFVLGISMMVMYLCVRGIDVGNIFLCYGIDVSHVFVC
jgi:hypothetical protein